MAYHKPYMKNVIFYSAASCWTFALIVHLFSVAGVDVANSVPLVYGLHVGLFVVWVPTILVVISHPEIRAFLKAQKQPHTRSNPLRIYALIFRHTPRWLSIAAISCLVYSVVNTLFFMEGQPGVPDIKNGQYILHNHGQLIRTLTAQEFHLSNANVLRGFSGIWMAGYAIACAAVYSLRAQTDDEATVSKNEA